MRLVSGSLSVSALTFLGREQLPPPPGLSFSSGWFVIMTVWVAAQILSSNVEYMSARLYNSSIIAGGSRDSEWKKGVDGPEASPEIQKDCIHAVKFYLLDELSKPPYMDSSSCFKIVCKELILLF